MIRRCFNGCGRDARPGFLTCDECGLAAAEARETPGTFGHALANALVAEAQEPSGSDLIRALNREDPREGHG